MREILFRGKRLDNDEWCFGSFVTDAIEQRDRENNVEDLILADGFVKRYDFEARKSVMHEVDRHTVGQYTGMDDQNGVKIFEGDILQMITDVQDGKKRIYTVNWCKKCGMWVLPCVTDDKLETDFTCFWGFDFKIIGNVHDNPELLEDSEA